MQRYGMNQFRWQMRGEEIGQVKFGYDRIVDITTAGDRRTNFRDVVSACVGDHAEWEPCPTSADRSGNATKFFEIQRQELHDLHR